MSVKEKKGKNKSRIYVEKGKLKIFGFIHQSLKESKYMISRRESAGQLSVNNFLVTVPSMVPDRL